MNVFILAAGSQTRWNASKPDYPIKQLLPVNGVPLIHRTLNQLMDRGIVATVVSKIPELDIGDRIVPEDSRFAVSSLYSTRPYWDDRNLVLLGDVYFTDKALDTCLNMKGIQFAGLPGEIFAVYWDDLDLMEWHLRDAIQYADEHDTKYIGKLWTLYRSIIGVDLETHRHNRRYYTFIKDGSRDFDKWSEYEQWTL